MPHIGYVISDADRVSIAASSIALVPTPTAARKVYYVRPTGSDTSGDGSAPNPWRSVQFGADQVAAISARGDRPVLDMTGIDDVLASPLVIPPLLAPSGLLKGTSGGVPAPFQVEGYLTLFAQPVVLLALGVTGVSQAADPVTGQLSITLAGATWTADQWKDKFLVGPNTADMAVIVSNTADTLKTTTSFFSDLTSLSIVDCGATLTAALGVSSTVAVNGVHAPLAINGIKLATQNVINNGIAGISFDSLNISLCDIYQPSFNGVGTLNTVASVLRGRSLGGSTVDSLFIVTQATFNRVHFLGMSPVVGWSSGNLTLCVVETCRWLDTDTGRGVNYEAALCQFLNCGCLVRLGSTVAFFDTRVDNAAVLPHVNPLGSGILVDGGVAAFLEGQVGGSGNAGVGVELRNGGTGLMQSGEPVTFSLTGALGDYKVGANPVGTWAGFVAKGQRETDPVVHLCTIGINDDSVVAVSTERAMAFSSTPVFDPTGATAIVFPLNGSITATILDGPAGNGGATLEIFFVHDGTSNTYAVTFIGGNQRIGAFAVAPTAGEISVLRLRRLNTLATPAWVKCSEQMEGV